MKEVEGEVEEEEAKEEMEGEEMEEKEEKEGLLLPHVSTRTVCLSTK